MKKQAKTFSDHSINIRRHNRKKQTQRLMNSIRFSNQFQSCIAQQQFQQLIPEPTPQYLNELLREENFDLIFHIIVNGGLDTIKMVQSFIDQIAIHLLQRVNTPKGALAINKLCRHSEMFVAYLYCSERMKDVFFQLKKMPIGSREHNIYLSCIFYILENKDLIRVEQIGNLYSYLQEIFYHEAASGTQSNLVTRIISCLIDCSNNEINFAEQFILEYFQSLWKSDNIMNHLNIYLGAIAVVKRRIYKKSLSILINAARVVLRGRGTLHTLIQVNLPSKVSILLAIFRFYNEQIEYIDTYGEIYSDKFKIQVTLHQFLLDYEYDIFSDFQRSELYLQFLDQFCKKGPSQQIVKKWDELGLIKHLDNELTESPGTCFLTLRVYLSLLSRDICSNQAGKILNGYDLKNTLVKVMKMYYEEKIVDTCLAVLGFLDLL